MQRLYITFLFMVLAGTKLLAQKSADVINYINTYKELAISEMKRTGIPAAIKIAQGIHETQAGQSDLVRRSNNHFGIKCKSSWAGERVYHDDDAQGECFRSYSRPEDSYMDHSDFLKNSPRYAFLFQLDPTDYEGWAYGLKKAGYATNIQYSKILIKLIRDYNLEDYTLIALGKMPDHNDVVVASANENADVMTAPGVNLSGHTEEKGIDKTYPAGAFTINNCKVIYAGANTAWLSIAETYDIPLHRLWDFNDIEKDQDIISKPQLVYLQRKPKTGSTAFHTVKADEDLYDICQAEGIRLESLQEFNHLQDNMEPVTGEKLFLQATAGTRPALTMQQFFPSPTSPLPTSERFSTHIVTSKETLYSISKKYGVEMEKIVGWNRLQNQDLKIGQELIIYKSGNNLN